jgi:7-cyano-7-deazaguanine synthase
MKDKAIVLASGGLDSTTVLAQAVADGFDVTTLSFRYGQKHDIELVRAREISSRYGAVQHLELTLDPLPFASSALTSGGEIPLNRSHTAMAESIAPTYVPARNMLFLTMALALSEGLPSRDIFIGVNYVDYSGYPDCRPAFIEAFEKAANLGTSAADGGRPFRIHAPLMQLSKAGIIQLGLSLGVDYGFTVTCYLADDQGRACGHCDACLLRRQGFSDAGVVDPTLYRD